MTEKKVLELEHPYLTTLYATFQGKILITSSTYLYCWGHISTIVIVIFQILKHRKFLPHINEADFSSFDFRSDIGVSFNGIITLKGSLEDHNRLYFVMEFVSGGDLMFQIQKDRMFSESRFVKNCINSDNTTCSVVLNSISILIFFCVIKLAIFKQLHWLSILFTVNFAPKLNPIATTGFLVF